MNRVCVIFLLIVAINYVTAKDRIPAFKKDLPPRKTGEPVEVTSSMYILDVSDVNENKHEFTVQMYFRQKWQDDRLKFNGSDVKVLPPEELNTIWRPDLFFVEESGGELHSLTVPNIFLRVFPEGIVFISMRMTLVLRCRMDLRYYPHDTQVCSFSIESYGHTANDIDLSWVSSGSNVPVNYDETINLPDFKIKGLDYSEESITASFGNYSRLAVSLTFQRKIGFFILKLVVPYILLIIASYVGFWIRPKFVLQRMSLLLVVLLIMIAISMHINSNVPESAYTKGVDVWISFSIALVFAAFLEFIYVSTIHESTQQNLPHEIIIERPGLESEKDFEKADQPIIWSKRSTIYRSVTSSGADFLMRVCYPILFSAFNVIYWVYYTA